jgi:hypothetical protein
MSKKGIFCIAALCALWGMAGGCQPEVSDQLKGKWQLKSIEQNGIVTQVDTVWYNFQSESLFMYQIYLANTKTYIQQYGYKTELDKNTLQLELTSYARAVKDFLVFTDWDERTRIFVVQKMNTKQLILRSEDKTYTFIAF